MLEDDLFAFGLAIQAPMPNPLDGAGEALLLAMREQRKDPVAYAGDVCPRVKDHCLPCVEIRQETGFRQRLAAAADQSRRERNGDEATDSYEQHDDSDQRHHIP